ncbi:MAG: DUF222 domain-containing protein [Leucobacter sp.]
MTTSFGPDSAHLTALDSVLDRLEAVEQRIRQAEAERIRLLAEAFDIAALESENQISSTPMGPSAELAYRAVRAEIAAALHQSEHTTERQLARAFTLTRDYPRTFDAYRDGLISERHTAVILDAGRVIGTGDTPETVLRRAAYETSVLDIAVVETPSRLRPLARSLAEQHTEHTLDERHETARRQRRVYVLDADDGMADLIAHLPAVEAYGIHRRLTRIAGELEKHEHPAVTVTASETFSSTADQDRPSRNRDEIRADALVDLLLENESAHADSCSAGSSTVGSAASGQFTASGALSAIHAQVELLVDGAHLFGARLDGHALSPRAGTARADTDRADTDRAADPETDIDIDPGTDTAPGTNTAPETNTAPGTDDFHRAPPPPILAGYGPIDTSTAKRLAGAASHWEIVHRHPEHGTVLSVERYRPSEQMRRFLGARDQHCRFPGCRIPAVRCDIDHTVDAALGGSTSTENLSHLCRGHHTLKHHTGWSVKQRGAGDLDWTSPTGRRYRERAPGRVRFAAADANGPPGADPF